ncbi:bifunctional folylpolyglutamate synthase/dihydrofolate synthase [Rhodohalobacter sp. 614A]|uniref:bifunctional folylpolyglutamate synthase/dihydrofolate synthase n=1 Tax=Rhodohalobacter sp. 614A TaxID=2908649 RepID=UPI001EFF57D3|nr:Mur ligase family protein [Rhodohalobacter sp. 614A]
MSDSLEKIKRVEEYLDSIPKFSKAGKSAANFNLARMNEFCKRMGNPQNDFKSIHIGGTNGKGTVCRMTASVYQQAGYKVGLYTSPHLLNVRERFQVNAQQIKSDLLLDFFDEYGPFIQESNFTYFEITTAIAFWFFSKKEVDIAILEVGLGGRLDATNVVNPEVSAITSIGLDHTDILGDTIEAIAFEKAGIIKKERPVVIGNLPDEAEAVVRSVAESHHSNILKGADLQAVSENQKIHLRGIHPMVTIDAKNWKKIDAQNVAIVYKIVETLTSVFPIKMDTFAEGIERVHTRFLNHAVFEELSTEKKWYFDGAHNEQSVKTLINHLLELAPANRWSVVLSFMGDKLNAKIAELWNNFPNIYLYEMEGQRSATIETMKSYFPSARVIQNHNFLHSDHFKSELVIFSGSFYFYNIVSNWMGAIASADQKNPSAL